MYEILKLLKQKTSKRSRELLNPQGNIIKVVHTENIIMASYMKAFGKIAHPASTLYWSWKLQTCHVD